MTVISLDAIAKNILMKRGYSLHWYIDFLVYCKDIMRELAFDEPILAIRYKVLPVNQDGNTVDLPDDFQDYCRVSAWVDQYIRPLVEENNIQLTPNFDSDFNIQPYADGIATNTNQSVTFYTGYFAPYWWTTYWNSYGENTGRFYGGVGQMPDTFRMDGSKNQIKINENLFIENIVLEYISNGMDSDSATHIDGYAQNCIEAGAMWQFYLHNRTYSTGEAEIMYQKYVTERQILRARLSDITLDRLKRVVQKNSIGIKY